LRTRVLEALRSLLTTPLLMLAGVGYGAVAGFLMGMGMAVLLWDEKFPMPVRWRPLQLLLRALFSFIAIVGWFIAGITAGALLPIIDRGTFVGIIRYGLPFQMRGPRAQEAPLSSPSKKPG
jgi:hypothetical protein